MNLVRGLSLTKSVRIAIPVLLVAVLAWIGLTGTESRERSGTREQAVIEPFPDRELPDEEATPDTPVRPSRAAKKKKKSAWDDPVQGGSATLVLEVADRDTHQPAAHFDLEVWRLDAPGNENWTAGDQLQARVRTNKSGSVQVEDLPEGAYRVIGSDAAQASEDPPAFRVGEGTTRILLEVPLPKPIQTFVRVYDEHGNPLRTARRGPTRHSKSTHADPPEWMRPRQPRDPGDAIGLGGGAGGSFHRPYRIHADARGFDLGRVRANTRRSTIRSRVRLGFDFHASVLVEASGEPATERTYAVVVLPTERFLQSACLPDGGVPVITAGFVVVTAIEARDYASLLRQTCKVEVFCRGFKAVEFEWCPAEALPPLVLEPEE